MNSSEQEVFSIGTAARRAGVRPSAIRYYEDVGLLPPAPRVGGWRQYTDETVDYVRVVRSAQDLGFALDEIRTLLHGYPRNTAPPERWRELAERKLAEVEDLIRRATAMRRLLEAGLNCGCQTMSECFLGDCAATGEQPAHAVQHV